MVATKMGRRANPHVASAFTRDNLRAWNDRSRENLGVDTLDLVQLHCPPSGDVSSDALFDTLDEMVDEKRMAAYGVSVETCEQALSAIRRPNVASIQIILNAFRRKPLEEVLPAAHDAGVGIIARVPLASGLLAAATTRPRRSAPTTTARSTGTASRSTSARRSAACPSRSVSRPRTSSPRSRRKAQPPPSSRCGGSSTSPALHLARCGGEVRRSGREWRL